MYNPFSLVNYLQSKKLENYWVKSVYTVNLVRIGPTFKERISNKDENTCR